METKKDELSAEGDENLRVGIQRVPQRNTYEARVHRVSYDSMKSEAFHTNMIDKGVVIHGNGEVIFKHIIQTCDKGIGSSARSRGELEAS